uniref:Uncharacterized protein n=1 Tax=Timema cristinae TaxID=61476 RepID=A0A7R9CD77_TIMCR|nr:unnamed protein product [Timema cristinae]
MGAQQAKERVGSAGALAVRTTIRNKPRIPKDGRQQGSNIFTEHSDLLKVTPNEVDRATDKGVRLGIDHRISKETTADDLTCGHMKVNLGKTILEKPPFGRVSNLDLPVIGNLVYGGNNASDLAATELGVNVRGPHGIMDRADCLTAALDKRFLLNLRAA